MEIMTYLDIIEPLYEEFPDVNKKSIRDVCRHGLAMFVKFKKLHHDIYLNNNREDLYYYFGQITNDPVKRYAISNKKVRRKFRMVYQLKKTKYSGYYHFALTEEEYQQHLNKEPIDRVILYKLEQEAKLYKLGIHKFRTEREEGYWLHCEYDYNTQNAEYIT